MTPRMRESRIRAARQAAGWHARRPARDDIRVLAELVLEVTAGRGGRLTLLVHELASRCRYACVPTAIHGMIRDHNRRATFGERTLPPLGWKARAFQRCFGEREAWEWLGCL